MQKSEVHTKCILEAGITLQANSRFDGQEMSRSSSLKLCTGPYSEAHESSQHIHSYSLKESYFWTLSIF
jgi:hypothetical protein